MAYVSKINGYDIKDKEARVSIASIEGNIGTIEELTTTDKADLVSAINEINAGKQGELIAGDNITISAQNEISATDTTYTAGDNITISAQNEISATDTLPLVSVTWSELKTLRDNGELVAGQQYRITDYVTTTVQAESQSAGHAFDVIVTADSASVLNENARAALHSGDTYFASSKINAWKLKYCIDNDTNRFAWADSTNGKGVIYQMIDEFGNNLPYDFKNIQFKRYKITARTDTKTPENFVGKYLGTRDVSAAQSGGTLYPSGYTISTGDTVWRYTFDHNGTGEDGSLNGQGGSPKKKVYQNTLPPFFIEDAAGKQGLNNIVFTGTLTHSNRFKANKNISSNFSGYVYSSNFSGYVYSSNFSGNVYYSNFSGYVYYSNFSGNVYYSNFSGYVGYSNFSGYVNSSNFSGNVSYSNFSGNVDYSNFSGNVGFDDGDCSGMAFSGNIFLKKFNCSYAFDSSDSSNYGLQFTNGTANAITVSGTAWFGEYEDRDEAEGTAVSVTVPAGGTARIFSYDDDDYEDGYSKWDLSYTEMGTTIQMTGGYD